VVVDKAADLLGIGLAENHPKTADDAALIRPTPGGVVDER
jgi:hypothetical protein